LCEGRRDAEPDARRGSGDERDLPGQVFQSLLLWVFRFSTFDKGNRGTASIPWHETHRAGW
jgi:hypothetical protein